MSAEMPAKRHLCSGGCGTTLGPAEGAYCEQCDGAPRCEAEGYVRGYDGQGEILYCSATATTTRDGLRLCTRHAAEPAEAR